MAESKLSSLLLDKRIVVALGAGGVGKTTTSIAVAVLAARAGKRVGLLSIDPAKRLASALGMSLGSELSEVRFPSELGVKGRLEAAMLDQKAVFDGMVRRHAPSAKAAEKILAHPLYIGASTKLGGPLEYMALAKVEEMANAGRYDLIVLDTPPDTQALDFLARPNILMGFMEKKVMTWLVKPFHLASRFGLARVMTMGEKLMGGIAEVTGIKALHVLAEFLVLMQEVISGFNSSGERIVQLLKSPDTAFLLVASPTRAAARSARNIATELQGLGHHVDALILNKCLPKSVANALTSTSSRQTFAAKKRGSSAEAALAKTLAALERRQIGESEVVKSLTEALQGTSTRPFVIGAVDEQDFDLHNAAGVVRFSEELERL